MTEVIYLVMIGIVSVVAAAVFAKRGQTELLRKLISELYEDIDSEELAETVQKLKQSKKK